MNGPESVDPQDTPSTPDAPKQPQSSPAQPLLLDEDDEFYSDELVPPMPTMGW